MKIQVEKGLVNYIESLQYEKDRTNEIVAFMLSHDYDTNTNTFKQWDKDNQIAYAKYREAKNNLENKYILSRAEFKNKITTWSLNFETGTLTVRVVNAEKD